MPFPHLANQARLHIVLCQEVLGHFKGLSREMGLAENLGVLINVKVMQATVDADHRRRLLENTDNRCFGQAIHPAHRRAAAC